jgi:cell division protein FtsL
VKRSSVLGRLTNGIGASIHTRGFALWMAALATGIVCVWQHVYSTELASRIEELKASRESLETEIGLLEMECVRLSSRERIESYAAEQLGMRHPESGEVIWLGANGRVEPGRRSEDLVEGTRDVAIDS